jgi:hypothetical protein
LIIPELISHIAYHCDIKSMICLSSTNKFIYETIRIFFLACHCGNILIVEFLLECEDDLALVAACASEHGHLDVVKIIVNCSSWDSTYKDYAINEFIIT